MSKTQCLEELQAKLDELNGLIKRAGRHCRKLKDGSDRGGLRVESARQFAVQVRDFLAQDSHTNGTAASYLNQIGGEIEAMQKILERQPVRA
ncbi:hypothetical protein IT414_03400 [bacterium]|nr:hypothetical protein [bacterium]